MDTTRIEIVEKQINQVVESLTPHSDGLTSGQVALIASLIGASFAILAQLIIFFLARYKEKGNLRRELIAEERRVAFLLTEFYKELVMHKVHKQYWYKTSEIRNGDKQDSKDSHDRHFVSNQRSFEAMTRIRVTTSEYVKTVTHFTNLTKDNKIIAEALNDIRTFKPRKASDFSNIKSYEQLLVVQEKEESDLNKVYLYYSDCFNKINSEMIKTK